MGFRNAFGFVFMMALAGIFLVVTGLVGYYPPGHLSLDAATWRRGTWTGEIILGQVALGIAFLIAAAVVARRINRRLAQGR
jgi:hypothetical protein